MDIDDSKTEGPKRRGFVITIKAVTPYKDYRGLSEEVRKALLATSPDKYGPQGAYRIDRVIVPKADKIKKEDWLKTIGSSRSMRPKQNQVFPGRLPGQGQPGEGAAQGKENKGPNKPAAPESRGVAAAEPTEALFVDPLTKESMENDYSITLLAVVILEPEPEAKPAETPGAAGTTVAADLTGATPGAAPAGSDATTAGAVVPAVAPTTPTDATAPAVAPAGTATTPGAAPGAAPGTVPSPALPSAVPAPAVGAPAPAPAPVPDASKQPANGKAGAQVGQAR